MTLEICAGTVEEWRNWLEENHLKEKKVVLIIYKKHTGKPSTSHREQIEEAICFGWIDTTVKKIDENKYCRNFVRRNNNSTWSKNTLSYGKKLMEEGQMSPQGLKMYKLGLKKKPHDHDIPDNPDVSEELEKALEKNKKAKENFYRFAPSYRRMYLRWLASAKLPETKTKRIKYIVKQSEKNKKFGE